MLSVLELSSSFRLLLLLLGLDGFPRRFICLLICAQPGDFCSFSELEKFYDLDNVQITDHF